MTDDLVDDQRSAPGVYLQSPTTPRCDRRRTRQLRQQPCWMVQLNISDSGGSLLTPSGLSPAEDTSPSMSVKRRYDEPKLVFPILEHQGANTHADSTPLRTPAGLFRYLGLDAK